MNFSSTDHGKNGFSSKVGWLDHGVHKVNHLLGIDKWGAKMSHCPDERYSPRGSPFPLPLSFMLGRFEWSHLASGE